MQIDEKNSILAELNIEKSWMAFEKQFKLVHYDYMSKLSKKHPNLTPVELRICSLIKINLSTKEMSNVLCQSSRSIETYRYRIRKKVNLSKDENLTTYLTAL